jgi:ubiquinone/menaquinone biosynthesis C-methylase UbiE
MVFDKELENFYCSNNGNLYPDPSLVRFIARNYYSAPKRKDIRIMEIGCGGGGNLWYLAREGFSVYGIDGSITAINKSKSVLSKEGLAANLRTGDFKNLPYDDNYFDAVIDITSVQHNDDNAIKKIVHEVHRVLVSGGRYFGIMIKDDCNLSDKRFFTNYLTDTDIKKYFNIFRDLEINSTRYTEENGSKFIEFHIITGSA